MIIDIEDKKTNHNFCFEIKEDISVSKCIEIMGENHQVPFCAIIKNENAHLSDKNYIPKQKIFISKTNEFTHFISINDDKIKILQQKINNSNVERVLFEVIKKDNKFKIIKYIPKFNKQYPINDYECFCPDNKLLYTEAYYLIQNLLSTLQKNDQICEILNFEYIYSCINEDENFKELIDLNKKKIKVKKYKKINVLI